MSKKQENKSLLKKQLGLIIGLSVVVVILIAASIILPIVLKKELNTLELPKLDAVTGDVIEYDAIKSDDGTSVEITESENSYAVKASGEITYTARPFIYPKLEVEELAKATITNATGEYSIYLDMGTDQHFIMGNEMQPINEQAFSNLRFQARFMLANERFEEVYDTEEKLAPFGLDAASNPVKVQVTDIYGNTSGVYIGNPLVSGNGYYAKDDDPYVYVLDSSVSVFFEEKNAFLSPMVVMPLSQNEYQYAESFDIRKNGEEFISSSMVPKEQQSNTGNVSLHKLTYPGNYPASFNNYYLALECFATLSGDKVLETNVLASGEENATEIFDKYGFNVASNDVTLKSAGKEHRFLTGTRFTDDDGLEKYYAYSTIFDTVVSLPVESAPFLDYELIDFINSSFFQMNITNVSEVSFNVGGKEYKFILEGEGTSLKVTEAISGKNIDASSFRQLYVSLLTPKIEGYAGVQDVTGDKELSFKVKSVFGEQTSYDFSVISTTRSLLTLDGSSEFYTARSYVTDIIEKLTMLMNGEAIASDF